MQTRIQPWVGDHSLETSWDGEIKMKYDLPLRSSNFLVDFISERGGIMTVFNGTTVIGWWRAWKVQSVGLARQ